MVGFCGRIGYKKRGETTVLYLESFSIPTEGAERSFLLERHAELDMTCYPQTGAYPFRLFPQKEISHFEFLPVTVFYGGNGSGKSTLLNIIAMKLRLARMSPFFLPSLFEKYVALCKAELNRQPPNHSHIITSDDVFDYLLDARSINGGVDQKRKELFEAYYESKKDDVLKFDGLDDYEKLKFRNEVRSSTKSRFTSKRIPSEIKLSSNGENALRYFISNIKNDALYLLDEPENSLSAEYQKLLASFLSDSARFSGCQLVISTHSPFLLSIKGARIYDLDSVPCEVKKWSDLKNVRAYYDLFCENKKDFE